MRPDTFTITGRNPAHRHSSLMKQALSTMYSSPTNIDDVGGQEVAAGHTGSAHEGVAICRHSSPRLQRRVGGVRHHGHSSSYRIHEC